MVATPSLQYPAVEEGRTPQRRGGAGRGRAAPGGGAGRGRGRGGAVRPRHELSFAIPRAPETPVLDQGTRRPVEKRQTCRPTAAIRSWLVSNGPAPFCRCKPLSCEASPGIPPYLQTPASEMKGTASHLPPCLSNLSNPTTDLLNPKPGHTMGEAGPSSARWRGGKRAWANGAGNSHPLKSRLCWSQTICDPQGTGDFLPGWGNTTGG